MSHFDDLCYRCREERSDEGYETLAGDHCHHEPREKPITVCPTCKGGPVRIIMGDGFVTSVWVKFCNECGRRLV